MHETHPAVASDCIRTDRCGLPVFRFTVHRGSRRDRRVGPRRDLPVVLSTWGRRSPLDVSSVPDSIDGVADGGDRDSGLDRTPSDGSTEFRTTNPLDVPPDRDLSGPGWVPSDDIIGGDDDRQVLVVGATVVGFTLALLLRCAGYDPLLVSDGDQSTLSRVTHLWSPALRTLADRLPDRSHGGERSVETISRRDDGLTVEFGDGVREWFDVVVDACDCGGSFRSCDGSASGSTELWQYETSIETDADGTRLAEGRTPNALVQRLPMPDPQVSLLRVTATERDLPSALTGVQDGKGVFGTGLGLDSELADVEPTKVRQGTVPDAETGRRRWAAGRLACCGGAACPFAPASGVRVSPGIEGAVAFARRVTRETGPIPEVVDRYAARRASRVTAVRRSTGTASCDDEYPAPASLASPLGTLAAFRPVALAPFLGSSLVERQRDGFDR